ncbi:MAG: enoyl-ACP reductase FabI, partial [Terriglobales bacterium]
MTEEMRDRPILVMGIANRWSLAYAIAKALSEAGARLLLTYQAERVKKAVEDLGTGLGATNVYPCDVGQDASIAELFALIQHDLGEAPLAGLVHSIAFAQKEDLERAFHATSRSGFNQALDISAYSLVTVAHHAAPLMAQGGGIVTLSYLGA